MPDGHIKISDASFSWNLYPDEYMYDKDKQRYLPVRWMAKESLTMGFYDISSDVVSGRFFFNSTLYLGINNHGGHVFLNVPAIYVHLKLKAISL